MALGAAGCGGKSDEDKARDTAEQYFKALGDGDGAKACGLLTKNAQAKAAAARGGSCARALTLDTGTPLGRALADQFKKVEVGKVKVNGSNADATLKANGRTAQKPLREVKEDGDWKVAANGIGR